MHILQVILEFSVVLGFMVLVHEFGHFAVAKLCGVRVEAFSIGFGPRLFGIRHNGTDYKICALPLGGYVKMAGEYGDQSSIPGTPVAAKAVYEAIDVLGIDINPSLDGAGGASRAKSGDFTAQPRSNRILIALAGPFSNFILSFVLLTLVAHYHHEVDQYLNGPAVVDYVPVHSEAGHDGLVGGDTIVSFNNVAHPTWDQILEESALNINRTLPFTYMHDGQLVTRELKIAADESDFSPESMTAIGLIPRMQPNPIGVATVSGGTPAASVGLKPGDRIVRLDAVEPHSLSTLHAYLNDRGGAPAMLVVLRNSQQMSFALAPERIDSDPLHPQFQIGITLQPAPVDVDHLPWGQSLRQSFLDNRKDSGLILRVLKGLFTRHVSVKQMSGPVGIAQDIDMATQMGIWSLLKLVSLISLNLGIFNLLPVPILDGGMILFLVIESVMRRDVNLEVKERVYQVAFVCIILFAFFVLFNDITKLHLGH